MPGEGLSIRFTPEVREDLVEQIGVPDHPPIWKLDRYARLENNAGWEPARTQAERDYHLAEVVSHLDTGCAECLGYLNEQRDEFYTEPEFWL
jgi:hypothetical protein